MFGSFFLVGEQFVGQGPVFLLGFAPLAGSGNRPQLHVVLLETHHDFGRRADHN